MQLYREKPLIAYIDAYTDPIICDLISTFIQRSGYTSVVVKDSQILHKELEEIIPDIVIMGYPFYSGIESWEKACDIVSAFANLKKNPVIYQNSQLLSSKIMSLYRPLLYLPLRLSCLCRRYPARNKSFLLF